MVAFNNGFMIYKFKMTNVRGNGHSSLVRGFSILNAFNLELNVCGARFSWRLFSFFC